MCLLFYFLFGSTYPDGTLLFVEGGNRTVRNHTNSPFSHVALIFNIDKEPWVFDANKPRVRKVKLEQYIVEIKNENIKEKKSMRLWVMKPRRLSLENTTEMRKYCEEQLGRKYSVVSYLTGKSKKGTHCGEVVAQAMIQGGIRVYGNPCKKSPQSIMDLARPYYERPKVIFPKD